jgi:hypothetical protein
LHEGGDASALVGMVEMQFYMVRAIGHLILSGAFERNPDLVFVLTEISTASEIPAYLARLDSLVGMSLGAGTPLYEHIKDALAVLHKRASEYFAANCYVAGPTHDLRPAHDLGTPNLMWGPCRTRKYSPFTLEARAHDVAGLAGDISALRPGGQVYGFDLEKLQVIADRIGPRSQIKTRSRPTSGALPRGHALHDFHGPERSGEGSGSLAAPVPRPVCDPTLITSRRKACNTSQFRRMAT